MITRATLLLPETWVRFLPRSREALSMVPMLTLNLELGYPTVEEARRTLKVELERSKARKAVAMKIVHGYGSSGVGGALRKGIRASLAKRKKEGLVQEVVFGENWDIFDPRTRKLLENCPELGNDRDLCRSNPGVSIVLL
jgi:hypothetical protein